MTFSQKEVHHLMSFEIVFIGVSGASHVPEGNIIGKNRMGVIDSTEILVGNEIRILKIMNFI